MQLALVTGSSAFAAIMVRAASVGTGVPPGGRYGAGLGTIPSAFIAVALAFTGACVTSGHRRCHDDPGRRRAVAGGHAGRLGDTVGTALVVVLLASVFALDE